MTFEAPANPLPAIEAILTMTLRRRGIISRATRCRQKNTPLPLTRMMRSQASLTRAAGRNPRPEPSAASHAAPPRGGPASAGFPRPPRSERLPRLIIATPSRAVLRRLVEFTQRTSLAFGQHCREAGVRPSMGSVGDAYDNALCESFFATLEAALLDRQRVCRHGYVASNSCGRPRRAM